MTAMRVVVVRTGTANLASVVAGLQRAGSEPVLSEDPEIIQAAARVVLPGVGAFGSTMKRLRASGLVEVLSRHAEELRPLLAVCVGMQLLCEGSTESPGVRGLSIVRGRLERFAGNVRVPQLGWNQVTPAPECQLLSPGGHAYFANSYRLLETPPGWNAAYADHDGRFVAGLERGGVQLACQFHPELSGAWGKEVMRKWLLKTA